MDVFEKMIEDFAVYHYYFVTQSVLNKTVFLVEKTKPNWQHGWGVPDRETKFFAHYFYRLTIKIKTHAELKADPGFYNFEHWRRIYKDSIKK